ncbi:MAG: nickel pincer cofactor biosynthesis protein LarC [Anaerolineae bacterium]|nr:nickel pincer cofactor biosynthesis protein LarC [Thermoflexales bacterium]MDW8408952.1 nickel pincer cofactor biosynthesis protein LarC [Anaerolineae bacterium]
MKIAYCDCFSGISGDMFLGALIDAGLPIDILNEGIARLHMPERPHVHTSIVMKGALRAVSAHVLETHGEAEADLPQHHDQHHDHQHSHGHGRAFTDITSLIEQADLSTFVKQTSLAIFRKLAEAEAHIHGVSIEEVHFHEVGAVDSIVDIVGAAIGLEYLGIERLFASALPMASGHVQTQHGLLPLPAPATLSLLASAQAPVVPSEARVELVTPTGAAILAALATFEQPAMSITAVGTGAGRRDLPWPNVLRLILGQGGLGQGGLVQIETNIDDMNPQVLGYVMGRLFAAGALDVFFVPIHMKKDRPATLVGVIARRADEPALARILLEETSTLGVRVLPIERRHEAQREMRLVHTQFGEVPVKIKLLDGAPAGVSPEYDVCARLAGQHHVPVRQVIEAALKAIW